MKPTCMVRKVDDLGRIVIPKEIRKSFGIEDQDPLEIFVDGEFIVLKKYEPACCFCGEARDMVNFSGKLVCKSCIAKLNKAK
jgi:transcriptional pleiotropic regulator of transition state genes